MGRGQLGAQKHTFVVHIGYLIPALFAQFGQGRVIKYAGVVHPDVNFDVKTRGSNKGTCATQRAEINLEDFGATDFFSAVALPEPQISLANGTYY
jgi:hypothetical protein